MGITQILQARLLAARALTQLNQDNIYAQMGIVDYATGQFQVGNTAQIRRAKKRTAYTLDPRTGSMTLTEGEFMEGSVTLENLAYDAYPVYAEDPQQSYDIYVEETGEQSGEAIAQNTDRYIYNRVFRTLLPTVGAVQLGDVSPLFIVAAETSTGAFDELSNNQMLKARETMNRLNVPQGNRYASLSSTAASNFLKDATAANNFISAQGNGNELYTNGLINGTAVARYGLRVMESNSIDGQSAVLDLDTTASVQGTLAIASVANDVTKFFHADMTGSVPIGAIDLTLTTGTALTADVAVGKIVRIGATGARSIGYGKILRVNSTSATAPIITLLLSSPDGKIVPAAGVIPGTHVFSIPEIPSISHAHHKEALIIANRNTLLPGEGEGAIAVALNRNNLALTLYRGSFAINRLRGERAMTQLSGAKCSDWRKGVMLLSI
jgi:hypothetical protein